MRPPFSYCGGKQKIVRHILPYIPPHTVYVEPFCGGATLLFAKPDYRTGNSGDYREVINDLDENIYNFFKQMRDNGQELFRMLELSLFSQQAHKESKIETNDPLLKAYNFYINVMQSFCNNYGQGWAFGMYSRNLAQTYKNKTECLKNYIERIRSIFIANEDYEKCIKRWDSPQTFFYCDPPYPETNKVYKNNFTQSDFEKLISLLDQCQGSFILSCYPNASVPQEWQKVEIEFTNSSSNTNAGGHRKKIIECIWIRQAKSQPRAEILKIYEKQKQLTFI